MKKYIKEIKKNFFSNKNFYINKLIIHALIGIILFFSINIFNTIKSPPNFFTTIFQLNNYIYINGIYFSFIIAYSHITKNSLKILTILNKFIHFSFSLAIYLLFSNLEIFSFTYILSLFLLTFFFENLITKEKKCSQKKEAKIIYESRKDKANYLKKLLTSKEKNMILIDGEWGIGKSYFVDSVVEKVSEDYHKIFVDVLLFSDKEQLINHTLNEINTILVNAGIRSNAIKKYKGILKVISESSPIKFVHFLDNDSLEVIEKNIENDLEKLGLPIYIIVDNLERILEMRRVIDILGFLHKIYEIGDNSLNIIVLADSSKLIKDDITSEYLQKFFPVVMKLSYVNKYEILESEKISIISRSRKLKEIEHFNSMGFDFDNTIYDIFKSIFDDLEHLEEEIYNRKDGETAQNFYSANLFDLEKKLYNPRNIVQIIEKSFENFIVYQNIYRNELHLNDNLYFKKVVLVCIFKVVYSNEFEKEIIQLSKSEFIETPEEGIVLNINQIRSRFVRLFFKEFSFIKYSSTDNKSSISKALIRLLRDVGKVEDDKTIFEMKKILKNEFLDISLVEYLKYFNNFASYLDNDNQSEVIYEKLMWKYYESFKLKLYADVININTLTVLEYDKKYALKYNKSIFDKIGFTLYPIRKEVIDNLKIVYLDAFNYFLEKYLLENEYIDNFEIVLEKCEDYFDRKFDNVIDLVQHIDKHIKNSEDFFKIDFKLLLRILDKISTLEKVKIINHEILELIEKVISYNKIQDEIKNQMDVRWNSEKKLKLKREIPNLIERNLLFTLSNLERYECDERDVEELKLFLKEIPLDFYKDLIVIIQQIKYETFKELFGASFVNKLLSENSEINKMLKQKKIEFKNFELNEDVFKEIYKEILNIKLEEKSTVGTGALAFLFQTIIQQQDTMELKEKFEDSRII